MCHQKEWIWLHPYSWQCLSQNAKDRSPSPEEWMGKTACTWWSIIQPLKRILTHATTGYTANPEDARLSEISPKPRHKPLAPFLWLLRILKLTNRRRKNGGCQERTEEWFCFGGRLFFPMGTGFSFTSYKKKKSALEDWLHNFHNTVDALSHAKLCT